MDCVIEMMKKCGIPLTVKHYLSLAYFGDITSLEELGEENLVEVIRRYASRGNQRGGHAKRFFSSF